MSSPGLRSIPSIVGEKTIASCRYYNDAERHFRLYLLENWIGLNETWQTDGVGEE